VERGQETNDQFTGRFLLWTKIKSNVSCIISVTIQTLTTFWMIKNKTLRYLNISY